MTRRTTLAEVAAAAGVSVATVSKVLNGRSDVAETTRARVVWHLNEASYQRTVRAPQTGPRRQIEVYAPATQNSYTMTVLSGVLTAAQGERLDVILRLAETLDEDRSGQPHTHSGAILITTENPPQHSRRLDDCPVVHIDPVNPSPPGQVSIGATNFAGGVAATEHLVGLGHRRIGHVAGPEAMECSQARLAGYAQTLRRFRIAMDEALIVHSEFTYPDGQEAARALLDQDSPPTAIFAASDEIALGIIEEARQRSIRVPDDLSIVGFDDTAMAVRSAPRLTTVAQPLAEMGVLAVRSLVTLMDGRPTDSDHIELSTRLVIRDSTSARTR